MIDTARDQEESLLAAKCFWMLAFDENNQNVMRSNESCMAALHKLKASSDNETRTAASGALWEIIGKCRHTENKGKMGCTGLLHISSTSNYVPY